MIGLFVNDGPDGWTTLSLSPPESRIPNSVTVLGDDQFVDCVSLFVSTCGTVMGTIPAPFGFTIDSEIVGNLWLNSTVAHASDQIQIILYKNFDDDRDTDEDEALVMVSPLGVAPRDRSGAPDLVFGPKPTLFTMVANKPAEPIVYEAGDLITMEIIVFGTPSAPNSTVDVYLTYSASMPSGLTFRPAESPGPFALGQDTLGVFLADEEKLTFARPSGTSDKSRPLGITPANAVLGVTTPPVEDVERPTELLWGHIAMDDDVRAVGDGTFFVYLILNSPNPTAAPRLNLHVNLYVDGVKAVGSTFYSASAGSATTAAPAPLKFAGTIPLSGVEFLSGADIALGIALQSAGGLSDYDVLYGSDARPSGVLIPVEPAGAEENLGLRCPHTPNIPGIKKAVYSFASDSLTERIPAGQGGMFHLFLANDGWDPVAWSISFSGVPKEHQATLTPSEGALHAKSNDHADLAVVVDRKAVQGKFDIQVFAKIGTETLGPLVLTVVIDEVADAPGVPAGGAGNGVEGVEPAPEDGGEPLSVAGYKTISKPAKEAAGPGLALLLVLFGLWAWRRNRAPPPTPPPSQRTFQPPNGPTAPGHQTLLVPTRPVLGGSPPMLSKAEPKRLR